VVSPYEDFFIASTGASAAILGLLVVAVSVVNADDDNPATRELRTVLAGNFSRGFRARRLNIAFASFSAAVYPVQLGLATALLAKTHSGALQRALVLVIVALYCSSTGRAWVVTGISRRE